MARPIKRSLDYFPLSVNFSHDHAVKVLCARNGNIARLALIDLWSAMYAEMGCYIEIIDGTTEILALDCGIDHDAYIKILDDAKGLGLLVEIEDEKRVYLTSKGVVKQYLEITKSSKRKGSIPEFIKNALPDVQIDNSEETVVNAEETPVNAEITPVNSKKTPQRKIKKSKENNFTFPTSLPVGESAAPLSGALSPPTEQADGMSLSEFKAKNPGVKVPGMLLRAFGGIS